MNRNHQPGADRLNASALVAGHVGTLLSMGEAAHARGVYHATVRGYKEADAERFLKLHKRREFMSRQQIAGPLSFDMLHRNLREMDEELDAMCEDKAQLVAPNVVMTLGKNFLLDNGMAGSAYTAAFYMLLISSVSYGAGPVAADTAASHAGWLEAGLANAPTYSGARKTAAWAAAAAGSKALSAGLVFTFTGSGTVKGCGLTTASAVDATTGTLFSAGTFTGGDQPVVATNTLTVTYSLSL